MEWTSVLVGVRCRKCQVSIMLIWRSGIGDRDGDVIWMYAVAAEI